MKRLLFALIVASVLATGLLALGQESGAPRTGAVESSRQRGPGWRDGGWWDVFLHGAASIGIVAALGLAALLFFENRFVLRPSKLPLVSWEPPGADVQECEFRARDGVLLRGWFHPGMGGSDPSGRPVLLCCRGSTGNITHEANLLTALAESGLAVLLFDYRGYGRSEGRPVESGLYLDGEAAHAFLVQSKGVDPERIICMGRSLGCAVALHVALRRRVAGVVLEGAPQNVASIVRARWPLLPLSFLIRNRFDTVLRARHLHAPLLVVHGSGDRVVPLEQGRRVFSAAVGPKQFYVVEGADHDSVPEVGGRQYYQTLREFCYGCLGRQGVDAGLV